MPPRNCERAVFGLTMCPAAKTPSSRGTRTSPVSSLTRTSANWAPKACIENCCASGFPLKAPSASNPAAGTTPPNSSRSRVRSFCAPSTIAHPQVALRHASAVAPFAQAGDEAATAEGPAGLGMDRGLVADARLDGMEAAGHRQLIHRRLEREHARALARRAHPRVRRQVEPRQPVGGAAVWGPGPRPGGGGGGVGPLPERGGPGHPPLPRTPGATRAPPAPPRPARRLV